MQKLVLVGTTPTPDHAGISKTGLGSEWSVDWEYRPNGLKATREFRTLGYTILALETSAHPTPLFELHLPSNIERILLVVGNEKTGIDPEILALADQIISLPMLGYKRSLNVATAAGIAIYYVRFLLPRF